MRQELRDKRVHLLLLQRHVPVQERLPIIERLEESVPAQLKGRGKLDAERPIHLVDIISKSSTSLSTVPCTWRISSNCFFGSGDLSAAPACPAAAPSDQANYRHHRRKRLS